METIVQRRANRPQQYIKTLKEATMEVIKLRTLKATKPTVKEVEAKLKILIEEDV